MIKQKIRKVRDLWTVHFGLQTQNEQGYILFASGDFELTAKFVLKFGQMLTA
jgi:hypothetical protein